MLGSYLEDLGKKSTFILFYVVGGIQFLVAVGLRSVLYCQPSLGG